MVRRLIIWLIVALFLVALGALVWGSVDVSARAISGVQKVGLAMAMVEG